MDHLLPGLDKATAESSADEVAESDSDFLRIMDIRVAKVRRGYVIKVAYETMGDVHRRILRTLEDVDRFLTEPVDFYEGSPEIQSWDADMGL